MRVFLLVCLAFSLAFLVCGCKSGSKKKSGDMMYLGKNDFVGFDMDNDGDFNKTRQNNYREE